MNQILDVSPLDTGIKPKMQIAKMPNITGNGHAKNPIILGPSGALLIKPKKTG